MDRALSDSGNSPSVMAIDEVQLLFFSLPSLYNSPTFLRIPRQLPELLPFRRLLQDGADSRWRPRPGGFSHLHFPSAQWLPHVDEQHRLCR